MSRPVACGNQLMMQHSYMDETGSYYSAGDFTRDGEATYDYMGQVRIVPASAEIPHSCFLPCGVAGRQFRHL